MTNTLNDWNPIFYAQEGLEALENALGMAGRVHRGYEKERNTRERGDTISIKKPAVFTAQSAPSEAQAIETGKVQIVLDQWEEVKFKLSDQELAYTGEEIIRDHIRPAAYALADKIDAKLAALYKDVPWYVDAAGQASIADLTSVYKTLFNNGVRMIPGKQHLMIDGTQQAYFQELPAFNQVQGAGSAAEKLQTEGRLGVKFNLDIFANQNVQSHTKGTCNDAALQIKGTPAKGATTIDLDAVDSSVTGTLVPGDTFVIAGNTQRYAVTNTVTAGSNEFVGVQITPPLAQAHSDNDAVTVSLDNHSAMMAWREDAFAFACAPLPMMAREIMGARVETITDPITGLSIRVRAFYEGNTSEVVIAFDILFGLKTLDPNKSVRLRG